MTRCFREDRSSLCLEAALRYARSELPGGAAVVPGRDRGQPPLPQREGDVQQHRQAPADRPRAAGRHHRRRGHPRLVQSHTSAIPKTSLGFARLTNIIEIIARALGGSAPTPECRS